MERNVKYVSIGIVLVCIVIGLCFFILRLGRFDFAASSHKTYYIYTQDELGSIGVNTPVKFKGIGVGKVSSVDFADLSRGQIQIAITLDSALKIKEGAFLSITSSGLAGANYLALTQGDGAIKDGNTIELRKSGLDTLLQKAASISDKADEIISNIIKTTNQHNLDNLSELLETLKIVGSNLNTLTKRLDSLVSKIDENFENGQYDVRAILNPTMLQLQDMLSQMNTFFSRATHLVEKIDKNPYESIFGKQKK